MIVDASKTAFIETWSSKGYRENWDIYGKLTKVSEQAVLDVCMRPFADARGTAIEIGCGGGFWTERLAPLFSRVVALDILPAPRLPANVSYVELGDGEYRCKGVGDETIDFAWSFGVFCHFTVPSIRTYVKDIFRVLKPGSVTSLFFSNSDRRPGCETVANSRNEVPWVAIDLHTAIEIVTSAGFVEPVDAIPELPDTMLICRKPVR